MESMCRRTWTAAWTTTSLLLVSGGVGMEVLTSGPSGIQARTRPYIYIHTTPPLIPPRSSTQTFAQYYKLPLNHLRIEERISYPLHSSTPLIHPIHPSSTPLSPPPFHSPLSQIPLHTPRRKKHADDEHMADILVHWPVARPVDQLGRVGPPQLPLLLHRDSYYGLLQSSTAFVAHHQTVLAIHRCICRYIPLPYSKK